MIMDVVHHRFFGSPRIINECEHFKFDKKGIDAVNINKIINHKNVQSCIPSFKASNRGLDPGVKM
jgi:hypothetical protein